MDAAAKRNDVSAPAAQTTDRRLDESAWDDASVRLDHELTGLTSELPSGPELSVEAEPAAAGDERSHVPSAIHDPLVEKLQRDAMEILQQWLDRARASESQTLGHVETALDEIEELRERIEHIVRELEAAHRMQADLQSNQKRVAETVATLHERVRSATELSRHNAAWLESLSQKPVDTVPSATETLERRIEAVEDRSTHALMGAGICVLVALIALIVAVVR